MGFARDLVGNCLGLARVPFFIRNFNYFNNFNKKYACVLRLVVIQSVCPKLIEIIEIIEIFVFTAPLSSLSHSAY